MEKIINWSELSRHVLKGNRNALRPKKIPKAHVEKLDEFFLKELPEWWKERRKKIKPE